MRRITLRFNPPYAGYAGYAGFNPPYAGYAGSLLEVIRVEHQF